MWIYQRIKNKKLWENFNNKKVFEKKKCEKKVYTKIACFQQLFLHSWKAKRPTLWHTYHKSWQGAPMATHSLPAGHKQCDSIPVI